MFNYINSLSEKEKINALGEFEAFINNPYWGVPFAGPSNPNGCKLTVYKPNNPQFAVQGAVDSSTRMLKLNVDTITTNSASIHNLNRNTFLIDYEKDQLKKIDSDFILIANTSKSGLGKNLAKSISELDLLFIYIYL